MIIGDNINITDLMLSSKGTIINYVSFLKEINKSDMNDSIYNENIIFDYDLENELVNDLFINNRLFATGYYPIWLNNTTTKKAFKDDSFNKGYN